ncbi:MAG: metallophosphoesterase family protein [Synergistaceae bacterium]
MCKKSYLYGVLTVAVLALLFVFYNGCNLCGKATPTTGKKYVEEMLASKQKMQFDKNGEFKVIFFSDLHGDVDKSHSYIKAIVDKEKPNLVLFCGDNAYVNSEEELKFFINTNMAYLNEKKIPWAQVFGNHDVEYAKGLTKETVLNTYASNPYNVSKIGVCKSGVGNYVLPIYASNGKDLAFMVWGLDSNMYLEDNYKGMKNEAVLPKPINGGCSWDYIKYDQVQWYQNTSEELEKYAGKKVPGIMFFHIPLPEMNYIPLNPKETGMVGEKRETINCSEVNSGLFAAILSRKDITGLFHGHDHINDFVGKYLGVRMAYVSTVGHVGYRNEDVMGARIVTIKESDPTKWETRMLYLKENGIYNDALDVHLPKDVKGEEGKTTTTIPEKLNEKKLLINFKSGFTPTMKDDLIQKGEKANLGTYFTCALDCNAEGYLPKGQEPLPAYTEKGRNGKGLQIIKPVSPGNSEISFYFPEVGYKGEKYLRVWVDFTEVDFRQAGFGLITKDGTRFSSSDNVGKEFLPLYVLYEGDKEWNGIQPGDKKWRVYNHGGNGRFGSAQNCGMYNFKGWLAVRVEDLLAWDGPATNSKSAIAKTTLKSGTQLKGFYFIFDLLDKRLANKAWVFDNISLVNDYSVFE